jgi:hypothetical protein
MGSFSPRGVRGDFSVWMYASCFGLRVGVRGASRYAPVSTSGARRRREGESRLREDRCSFGGDDDMIGDCPGDVFIRNVSSIPPITLFAPTSGSGVRHSPVVPRGVDRVRCRDYCRVITDSIVSHMNEAPSNRARILIEMLSVRRGCGSSRRSPKGVPSLRFDVCTLRRASLLFPK